jgi:hypothetical protein
MADVEYCEAVETVTGSGKYTVKDLLDTNEVLLFVPRSGLNLCGQFGGYFVKSKAVLWAEWRKDYWEKKAAKARQRAICLEFWLTQAIAASRGCWATPRPKLNYRPPVRLLDLVCQLCRQQE